MKKFFIVLFTCLSLLFTFSSVCSAQTKKEKIKEEIFSFVDSVPQFINGRDSLAAFLLANMEFPAKATKKGIKKAKVYVQFVVKTNGEIVNCTIEKSTDNIFDKEAIRLVELMPAWKPAVLNGKIVNSRYTLPIKFGYSSVLDSK